MALVTSIFNALTDSLNKKLRPVSFSLTADLVALQAVRFVPIADLTHCSIYLTEIHSVMVNANASGCSNGII